MTADEPTPDRRGHDLFGPLERSTALRGWLLLVVAVVVGVLLMPSATRASLPVSSAPSATTVPLTSSTTTTTAPASAATTTTTAPANAAIHVLVANGTNTAGAASTVTSFLAGKGFSMLSPLDALTTVAASQVYAIGGAESDAQSVAHILGLSSSAVVATGAQPVPVASVGDAQVVVVVGPDLVSSSSSTS